MSTPATAPKGIVKPFSVRRLVNRRISRFSLLTGTIATGLTMFFFFAAIYPSIEKSQEINRRTVSKIRCVESRCDTSVLTTDWELSDGAYVVDTQTRNLLNVPGSTAADADRFEPLNYSDTDFIAKFRQPTTYTASNGEIWRLYSRVTNDRQFEIIVGYAEQAPWKMIKSPQSLTSVVDDELEKEAEKIADSLQSGRRDFHAVRTDGFEVVSAETQQVVDWGPWLPIHLPEKVHVPSPGSRPYVHDGNLYWVQTYSDGRLYAVSLVSVGSLVWLGVLVAFALLASSIATRLLCRRFLRNYFALRGVQTPTIEKALRDGEGQSTEFKRAFADGDFTAGKSNDEIVKSVAAFANTGDGVIFLGIDDNGHVKGLDLDFKQKDRLEQKIRQLIQNRIKPMPPMQITFDDVRGLTIAKIIVARGDAPIYMMDGRIYIRSGSSDIQAQPDDVGRLFTL